MKSKGDQRLSHGGTLTSRGQAKDKEAAREKRKNYQGCRRNLQMYLPNLGKKVYQGRWADWLSRMVLMEQEG